MKAKLLGLVASLVLFGAVGTAQANTIDVSATASGASGNWTYDFSFTNNMGVNSFLYYLGISTPGNISGTPIGFIPLGSFDNIVDYGGSSNTYNNTWYDETYSGVPGGYLGIANGTSLGGFKVHDTSLSPLSSVRWFVFAYGENYTGPDHIYFDFNPGFEGSVSVTAAATPLPAALPLFATGLGVWGLLGRRRKRKNAAAGVTA